MATIQELLDQEARLANSGQADSDFRKRSESISPGDGAIVGIVLSETATDVAVWVYGA